MSNEVTAEILGTHLLDLAREGRRLDGRAVDEYRKVTVEPVNQGCQLLSQQQSERRR